MKLRYLNYCQSTVHKLVNNPDSNLALQDGLTMPNKLVARMEGPHGTGLYRCEVTIETPRFITKDLSKNVTVVGKSKKGYTVHTNLYRKVPFDGVC